MIIIVTNRFVFPNYLLKIDTQTSIRSYSFENFLLCNKYYSSTRKLRRQKKKKNVD